jgi:PAS domain S-box-containing protein/putative nucleotidyltransferase with HDIG domain
MDTTDGDARLRVLCLEDSASDAELVHEALVEGGLEVDFDLATERGRFEELLAGEPHNIILADFSLPGFDAHEALALAQAASPETPFICVSGTIGEGATVELLKQGAADCVLKDRLERLPFAIERAIAEARHREALRESEERYRDVLEHGGVGVAFFSLDGRFKLLNRRAVANMGGGEANDFVGKSVIELFGEDAGRTYLDRIRRAADSADPLTYIDQVDLPVGPHWLASVHTRSLDSAGNVVGVHVYAQDITELKQAEEGLRRSSELLSRGENLAHLGSWKWDVASGVTTVSEGWQRLHGLSGERFTDEEVLALCHPDDRAAVQAAVDRAIAGEPYRVDHRIVLPKTREVRRLMTYGEVLCDVEGRLETVIGASLDVTERVRADEVLREREERLQRALTDTVAALGATVAMRDPYTADHERRVAELASLIAERLGWSVEAIERLRTAALVHDVGKIAVPAEILSKPSRLTETEFALIKGHSQAAYEILAPIDFGGPVAEIVYQHHERLDGSGYPQGLRGDEILPGARLLAVADVVEAMITHRPYRAALPLVVAIAEIESGAGSRYDAAAAAAAVRLIREEGFTFSE